MPTGGQLLMVQHQNIADCATSSTQALTKLKEEIEGMTSQVKSLKDVGWGGIASESFMRAEGVWQRAASDLAGLLVEVSGALNTANDGFRTTENRNRSRFE